MTQLIDVEVAVPAAPCFMKMYGCSYITFLRHAKGLHDKGIIFKRKMRRCQKPIWYTFPSLMQRWAAMGGWEKIPAQSNNSMIENNDM